MGKNQHSKDLLHLRPTEWAQDGAGFKERKRNPFARLPLNCCFLSFQPFENPVCTRDGCVFDAKNIIKYIKRFGVHPIRGGKLEVSELKALKFHYAPDGKMHCPVTFKDLSNSTKVVVNTVTGNVISYDAYDQLNRKPKHWKDLITSEPFKPSDIIVIQDPAEVESREVAKFYFVQAGQQDEVNAKITSNETEAEKEDKKIKIRSNAAMDRIFEEKQKALELKQKEAMEKEAEDMVPKPEGSEASEAPQRKTNERFTSGEVAESFTSTSTPLRTQNNLRLMTEEEDLQELYATVRKKKLKAYVRLITTAGMINVELHSDFVPHTTDNFIRLCEKDYYDGTIFHRLIRNFMIQGGDPTGTGRGGESAFEGGKAFKDEFDSRLLHQGPGVVSMANNGKNTNKSQFFISLKSCQHLDNKHSVFGRVVGGLELLNTLNNWECDEKDRPIKEIKLIRTEVFKNPFTDVLKEAAKPKVEKILDPVATWFSNRKDPMEEHKNRYSKEVGKYLESATNSEKNQAEAQLPPEEVEYANTVQKAKKQRTSFDFSAW